MLRLVFVFFSMFILASAARAETQIVTTILPLEGLVRAVGGTHISVETLGDGRTSPHDLRLTPIDRQRLNQADLVLMVDPSLEPFMTRLIPQLKQVLVLSKLNGLTLLETEEEHHHGHHDEHHDDAHDDHHDEHHHDAHHDKHDDHDAHQDADKFLDPHLWLDPHNSITIAMELAHVLGKIAPAHADAFTANAKTLAGQMRALDRTLTKKLAATKGKKYVLFHDAFSYFTAHYQIDIPAVVASETHGGMGVHELNDLRNILASGDIACLFTEPQFSAPIVAQIANDYGIAVGVMDPLGSQLPRDTRHPLALYESIAQAFITCDK